MKSNSTVRGLPADIYFAHLQYAERCKGLKASYDPILAATELTVALLRESAELHRTAWANAKPGNEYERQAAYFIVLWRASKRDWAGFGKLALYQQASGRKGKNVAPGFKLALKERGFDYDTLDRPEKKRGRAVGRKDGKKRSADWGGDDPDMIR